MSRVKRTTATVHRHAHQGQPHRLLAWLEWRALGEAALLPWAWPALRRLPRGDGHPVLLLPGFLANEGSLTGLRRYLQHQGYAVQTWGLGRNLGFQRRHAEAIEQQIRYLHHQTGRKVSLVGWSLGGVFALHGANQAPGSVRQLITLGSPVSIDESVGPQSLPLVKLLYRLVAHPLGPSAHAMRPSVKRLRERRLPPVPISCLYSTSDGVVPPQEATVEGDARCRENIRVTGSHTGLVMNPMVLAIVAERLAQPEGGWRPFRPEGLGGAAYRLLTHEAVPI